MGQAWHLTKKFAPAIEVVGIGYVGFGIAPMPTRKDAVRAKMDRSRSDLTAKLSQAKRQQCVNGDAWYRSLSFLQLLDDSEAIQHYQERPVFKHVWKCRRVRREIESFRPSKRCFSSPLAPILFAVAVSCGFAHLDHPLQHGPVRILPIAPFDQGNATGT